jgi:gliding motility-associated-like protein
VLYDCPNVKYVKLAIFNRWGETVYESTDINGKWDGTYRGVQVPAGIYVYFVDFTGAVNTTEHTYKLRGSLTLIR